MHIIEKTEMALHKQTKDLKDFRHNYIPQRAAVVAEATAAWGVVQNIAKTIEFQVDNALMDRTLIRFQACPMDGYDLISTELMFEHGIPQVISSDADFASVAGISLFTANVRVLADARTQNRLLVR
jgi:predicted nucleic acid-binding protein